MTQGLQKLSTRYALSLALLLTLLMLLVLSLGGYLVYENTSRLRAELVSSFSSVQSENDLQALQASGAYLSNRLFTPLFNMDISGLNEELEQIQGWLDPQSILVVDQQGRVVTDGSAENQAYGRLISPPAELAPYAPVIERIEGGHKLYFSIGYGDEVLGFTRIALSDARNQALLSALEDKLQSVWGRFERGFVAIGLLSIVLVLVLSALLGVRLSASLSQPLAAMTQAAEQYAAGNLSFTLPELSNDDLGRLAHALNTMANDLQRADLLLMRAQEIAAFGSWEQRRGEQHLSLSHGVFQILGVSPQTFNPTVENFLRFVVERDRERLSVILQGSVETPVNTDFTITLGDGRERALYLKGEPKKNREGVIEGFLGTLQDISEQRQAQEQLVYMANYDHLTRLPNRNLFYDRMRHATEKAKRCGEEIALLFLDIDRFKHVNDTLGHDIGDELLRQVARRLQSVVRRSDTLARMGGDEFTIIAEDIGNDLAPQKIARQVIDALSPAFLLGERSLCVSASIGIALFPKDAEDIDTLIRNADTAMYVAKEQGRATFRFFTAQLNQLAHQRLEMEQNLRQAIAQQHFELHYQPQVQASDGRLIAIEALLRWRQDGEPQSPEAFIPVLEEIGLITQITGWVLREACAAGARLAEQGAPDVRVAVNLSAMQFQQSDLPDLIDEALADSSIQPEQLEVEITESTLLEREHSRNNASQLVKRGVRIAIDDFGTGYSSLTYLKRFRVDALKIDRSFVQNILSDPEDAQITSAVIALAQGLVIDCVAEGVEDIAQFHLLRELGCELIQGYLVCRPIDSDALMVWAASQSWRDDACFWSESA